MTRLINKTFALCALLVLNVSAAYAASEAHGGAHEGAAEAGLPQFDPSSYASQIFWLVVTFAFLYVFFAKKTLPEISKVIEQRSARISSDIEEAEKLREQAEEVHRVHDEGLDQARAQANKVYADAESSIKAQAEKKYNEIRQESAKAIEEAEKRLQEAKIAAMEEMSVVSAEVASHAAEKIAGVKTDIKQVRNVVQSMTKDRKKAA